MYGFPPEVWTSDGGTPRTPYISSNEGDTTSDENLIHEVSGCPTIRRLQRVALRHKNRSSELQMELDLSRADAVALEVQAEQHAHHISELSTYIINMALERDQARKLQIRWKLCSFILGFVVFVCYMNLLA